LEAVKIEKVKFRYVIPALKQQMPIKRFLRNFFVTGNAWGMFSKHAHYNKKGKEKVGYNTLETANKAAASMKKKYGYHYSVYLCPRCGKYHLGRNRDSIKSGT
jgi:predicted RNA-binding Zn-ribbon protein involved in translation (DUF1610 family)